LETLRDFQGGHLIGRCPGDVFVGFFYCPPGNKVFVTPNPLVVEESGIERLPG